ncbi:hypothetical protein AN0085.2 [Aspergillus nidulans FGSC A4]|uniref:Uncharacterized protein n=1 Tax=Emericella nidulans (strain FGSC A4 / ATCC 38163 / CBS 112.46 / NRRL 194 / M139) TaxID=227321 RepID=Q5BH95_EMENI|nr:hypothetical protein [Aspergillus nidulans FGSC A4]EAA65263.1 hypothetical protein AN0085.2 [Aspergillus nidulans FGSC A4]CBF90229.1 TPA: conserved hypothetical protein [Aspergillus nidulans FGSC A4]|eukprot:XP_657689.1 hypothetical protein AN0085.2 [Aspergillus nidulans FGSC A4]
MTSTPPADHPQQPLSESWATLSASDAHSEDGAPSEQTDTGSLIDPSVPDDVASLDERYSSSDDIDAHSEDCPDNESYDSDNRSDISESQDLRLRFPQIGCSIDDSNLTTKTALYKATDSIQFIEPDKWPDGERVQLKHTIRLIDGPESAELGDNLTNLQDSTLMVTLQQTIMKKSINTDRPFRVLYLGNSEFRGIILDKLGDVLVSSTSRDYESSSAESSRYHVVPTSFGAGAFPNFAELLPIHFQLIVDECLEATSESHIDRPRAINLKLKNRPACTSHWTGTEYGISSSTEWTLPDMAIFFLSSLDDLAAVETQKLARMFMERHGVPVMVISEKPLWKMSRELVPINHHSLHMCLESRKSSTGKTTVLKRYPIDLNTFESIAPCQLNKNLASLTSICPRKHFKSNAEVRDNVRKISQFGLKNITRKMFPLPYLNNDTDLAFVLRLIMLTILSTATLALGYIATNAIAVLVSSFVTRAQESPIVDSFGDARRSSFRTTTQQLIPTSAFDGWSSVKHCNVRSLGAKKMPKFNVQVDRRGQPLQYELSRLFEVKQMVLVDLGTPWLKIANWKRAAQSITSELVRDVGTAQTGLSEVYGRISTELQVLAGDVVKRTHLLRQKASLLRRESLPVSINTEVVLSASTQLSETLRRTAMQPFLSASHVLRCHTKKANIEAGQIMSTTWNKIGAGAQQLSFGAIKEHIQNARKSKTLDKAHKRARRLMKRTS